MKPLTLIIATLLTFSAHAQTLPEIQKDFDAADYRTALQKISKSLAANDPTPEDQYRLLMLKAESLLRLKERTYAIDAYNAASRVPVAMKDAAAAKAMAVLISRSQGAYYKPNNANGDSMNIVTSEKRKEAFKAAYEDLLAANQDKLKGALKENQLPPLLQLVPTLGDLFVLEQAATGETKNTTTQLQAIGKHAEASWTRNSNKSTSA